MRNFHFMVIGLLSLTSAGLGSAQEAAPADLNCDIADEQTVYWAAMSQAVTLRTQIKSMGDYYPLGYMTLVLEDGTEIDLGEGRKYIDDGPEDEFGDCNKHLEIAKADTLASLSKASRFTTLKSLWSYSVMGQDCMDVANLPEDGPSSECRDAAFVHERFMDTSPETPMKNKQFRRLLDSGAPLITVRRSTYYSETYVYDAQTNTLHNVLTEGC